MLLVVLAVMIASAKAANNCNNEKTAAATQDLEVLNSQKRSVIRK